MTGIQAVGVVLTSALLVTPAATASLRTRRLGTMMLLAAACACLASVLGLPDGPAALKRDKGLRITWDARYANSLAFAAGFL